MIITNLIENTEGAQGLTPEHGLSFYIETSKHKLLMDTGAGNLLLENAEKLGINLKEVDTLILSHGHYDHSGGIMPFASINKEADIYMQKTAILDYYSIREDKPHYIGIDKAIANLPNLHFVGETLEIDSELLLFSGIKNVFEIPSTNRRLKMKAEGELVWDDFNHEQCLVITHKNKKILMSGCAHHGILNIMERYKEIFKADPDVVISGFHLLKKSGYSQEDIDEIEAIAKRLLKYDSVFYTCHCTGVEPYEVMKSIMGERLKYIHCGDTVKL
ncbi:MAG: MBL fold metallo-hydrolase [Lachnospiraceae bacterium]|nr:MBL fold metallo-hydrolase [Lachnospiraceae bacterium]